MSRREALTRLAGAALLLGAAAAPATAAGLDSLAGHWEGAYSRQGSVQIVRVDLVAEGDSLAGTYDIPELAIDAELLRGVRATGTGLELRLTYGAFDMHVAADGREMTGTNARWNPPVFLHLKRARRVPAAEPALVALTIRSGPGCLSGTLVIPEGRGPHPAVVIVHGSGPQGRADGFYRQWGAWFARRGIAALIYDKRGVGESAACGSSRPSQGAFDVEAATFDDLAGDVSAWVEQLRRRPEVEAARIGLFGISQGGWIAPLAAARLADRRVPVAFLILDVGPAVTVREQELDRVEYTMKADEAATSDIDAALAYTRDVFAAAYGEKPAAPLLARADAARAAPWAAYVQIASVDEDLDGWRRIRFDPAPVLARTRVPLLALFGENDTLVPPAKNAEPMRRLLAQAGDHDATIRVIPGANHEMETYGTLLGGEWKWPEHHWVWAHRAPQFEATIEAWLRERGLAR